MDLGSRADMQFTHLLKRTIQGKTSDRGKNFIAIFRKNRKNDNIESHKFPKLQSQVSMTRINP